MPQTVMYTIYMMQKEVLFNKDISIDIFEISFLLVITDDI